MRIIPRRIEMKTLRYPGWKMLYGRRKTGKSFIASRFLDHDLYYFVQRDGAILERRSGARLSYQELLKELSKNLGEKTIVIDEFHRLPEDFLDFLHANAGRSEKDLVLLTSTLWLSLRLLSKKESPLLGVVLPIKIGLIDEREVIIELSKEVSGKELVEASTYLREPMLVPLYKPPLREFMAQYLYSSGPVVEDLIGEAFTEEEILFSEVYRAILHAVADGKSKSGEIASYLVSQGLLDSPSSIQKYLKVLSTMDIIRKVPIFRKRRRFSYSIASPLLDLHFYLSSKYAYTELETPLEFIRSAVNEKVPRHVEKYIESLLGKVYGLRPVRIEEPDLEVDIALQGFKRLELVGEVKWKSRVKREEVWKIEEKLSRFNCRKVLVVPDESVLESEPKTVEVLTPEDLLTLAQKSLRKELGEE
ncbi:archaeal ATPase [Thermococcus kodakarensis KOD1]|uniref:Archaeal ATPase n=1 Tax=Thermococcus kodakarensis (strain ATCC BAA-918 / JCM 12380 / KOD1) TaxID=69014 RepID=Q5JHA4_THEKO|nr:ATPase [Thermococcus kodakarensis]WCN28792.1 ATPase [Thermococcus kodakarensis]WCN31091.1 ATPase [Thermococcus kodakarensis]BAD84965.1 archaeal ATPase [Thermococcus kodakarensis KOD1]